MATTTMNDLEKMVSEMKDELAEAKKPVHVSKDRTALSFWDRNEDKERSFNPNPRRKAFRRRIPRDYTPHAEWQTFGDMLQEGCVSHFREKLDETKIKHLKYYKPEFYGKYSKVTKAIQGMSESVGGDGGFAVLPEFAPDIFDRVYQNDIFNRTDSYTVVGNRMTFPRNAETSRATGSRAGGIQAYWVDEGATVTSSNPKLAETELKLKKLAVVVYLTNELIEDNAYALEQWVTRKVSEEFNFMVGNSIFNGNGGGQPTGILNSNALISVAKESDQNADTIVYQNIVNMFERRLSIGSIEGLAWFCNQSVEPQLQQLSLNVGTGGVAAYLPPGGLSASPYATILGRPVVPVEFCPALGDKGDIVLADFSQYCTITKGGITEAISTHVEFLTDQMALRFTMRVDGRPYDDTPITPFTAGTTTPPTQSPFVTLDERA